MVEKDYVYEVETGLSQLDGRGFLKPYAYQALFGDLVQRHLTNIGYSHEMTVKYGLAWVLVSLSFEIAKPVRESMRLQGRTWHSERRGPFFRREAVFTDEQGQAVFSGSTFSVLIDIEKRTAFRQRELPFSLMEPVPDFCVQAEPVFRTNMEYAPVEEREVKNSHIDALGHVNNGRYGEYAYDTFTDAELEEIDLLKRIDVFFISELKNRDTVSILKARDGKKVFVRGLCAQKTAFDYILEFK